MTFIAVEGVDGAGCGTQATLLHDHLSEHGATELVSYPNYDHPLGQFIKQYLYNDFDLAPITEFLLYTADMANDADKMFTWLQDGQTVVADRYLPSTLAYQSVNGVDRETMLHFLRLLELPIPDLVIYLDVDVETAQERKQDEKDQLDKYEADTAFREQVRTTYKELVEAEPLGMEWITVDASNGVETVQAAVQDAVHTRLTL